MKSPGELDLPGVVGQISNRVSATKLFHAVVAMLKTIIRHPVACLTSISMNCLNFSLISVYSRFPATLYQFQITNESQLHDQKLQQEDSEVRDAINVSKEGLVYLDV